MNASAVNIPLVNSTQILTTPSQMPTVTQAPITSVVSPTPLVASTPIVSQTPMVASTPIVSQVPVAASTPIVSQAVSQVPMVQTTPLVSQVPMVQTTPVVSQVPMVAANDQHYANQVISGTLVDEDYRLGRGILDEFRPPALQAQYGVVVPNTTGVVTASALPVATTQVLPTSAVIPTSAVVPSTVVPNGGANALKEFL